MKEKKYIRDEMRKRFLAGIYNSVRKGESVLLIGEYGTGKSSLLEMLAPKTRRRVTVESLDQINEIMSGILNQLNYTCTPSFYHVSSHLREICKLAADIVIVLDEANDLQPKIWPYMKRMMNAGIPIVFAGLPDIRAYLERKHRDILSRLRVLELRPIAAKDYAGHLSAIEYSGHSLRFDSDAVNLIYAAANANMRVFDRVCEDCMDKALEKGTDRITLNDAAVFVSQLRNYDADAERQEA